MEKIMLKTAIIMGSDSDLAVVRPAADKLKEFGIAFEVRVISAHRTPAAAAEYAGRPEPRPIWPALWLQTPHCLL